MMVPREQKQDVAHGMFAEELLHKLYLQSKSTAIIDIFIRYHEGTDAMNGCTPIRMKNNRFMSLRGV
ncbi:MAG: hypothetical protein DSY55_01710 [Clostridia bacterium]|nr:MAG: hypothetical protein DSY55_01710 [Clostridia bacterium]